MSFFAVLFALLIEQLKPLPRGNWVHDALISLDALDRAQLRRRRDRHAWVVWGVTVLAPALAAAALYLVAAHYSLLLALAVQRGGAVPDARLSPVQPLLHRHPRRARRAATKTRRAACSAEWRHLDASELPRTELLRHVIEHSLLAAHRHVFGVFFWFVVLSAFGLGPGRRGALPHGRVRRAATGPSRAARSARRPTSG